MRCAGCGGKVGGSVLHRVLSRLEIPPNDRVLVGLDKPDDAAVIATRDGQPVTVTTDFFTAPLDDPYLVGRIAALNAGSDIFAMGAKPHSALAMATIPVGKPPAQEQLLYELLAGSNRELSAMGATLVGGHTIEGPQITLGFTLLADTPRQPRTKNLLRPGDLLVLTKPLGTGVLLAAQMRAECRAEWFGPLLESMLLSNQSAAETADQFDVRGMTDVTGFGLAGHLLEMLRAADIYAELRLDRIELLHGTADLIAAGVESTLAPANRAVEADISVPEALRQQPSYAALFDPQTSGGLLLGIAEKDAEAFCRSLVEQSDVPVAIVGHVVEAGHDRPRLAIV
jgi:selenide,water dikinase